MEEEESDEDDFDEDDSEDDDSEEMEEEVKPPPTKKSQVRLCVFHFKLWWVDVPLVALSGSLVPVIFSSGRS